MRTTDPRREPLYVTSIRGLTDKRLRRILYLSGFDLRTGLAPGKEGRILAWGSGTSARRAAWLSKRTGRPILRVEDAFLRSLHPGRSGEAPFGVLIDRTGLHLDAARPSDLETLLQTADLSDPGLLHRAADAREAFTRAHLSKYAATDVDTDLPWEPYVVVVDQVRGDAATRDAPEDAFAAMLAAARAEHPGTLIAIKTHPETRAGHRPGHFAASDLDSRTFALETPVSPTRLFAGATAVYTHSSTLGLEAIWAGHAPHVFGTPIYAGWGLTRDRGGHLARRTRKLSRDQLFAATMILAPTWYDPFRDRLCEVEDVIDALAAISRAWREDRHGWTASGISAWKRPHFRAMFGQAGGLRFGQVNTPPRRCMTWGRDAPKGAVRVEDGFLRSRGLGAALTPPLSLALDDLGIYYDPTRESRLERLIGEAVDLPLAEIERSRRLIARLNALGLSKYNLPSLARPDLPNGPVTLVAGQVEDDASLLAGGGAISTNAALLAAAKAARPDRTILYKPHPDVEGGLRSGHMRVPDGVTLVEGADPGWLLARVDEVWTMTSLIGFEALLRGVPVVTTGAPFYAGWGLTEDRGAIPARRRARPSLEQLVHAALIGYPRYHDPITNLPCPVEVAVERLADGSGPVPRGILAHLQSLRARLGKAARRRYPA